MIIESIKKMSEAVFGKDSEKYPIPEEGCWTMGANGIRVDDSDLIRFTLNHMKFIDKWIPSRIITASLHAGDMLLGYKELPKSNNWKFEFFE